MTQQASPAETNRFVQEVDKFMANYETLKSPANQKIVYESNNPQLIADYENAINSAGRLSGTIESTVGAWNQARRAYTSVTDVTSTGIGDAIDEIRSWFGYDPAPGIGGLGAVQIVPAVWMAGIVAAAVVANNMMSKVFVMIKAAQLERTGVSPERAAQIASQSMAPGIFKGMNTALLAGGALALFILLRK